MDWRTAYLAQARSDFEVFNRIRAIDDLPLCQKLHYLQMATEKFAKGYLTAPEEGPYERTHNAFQRFVRFAKQRADIRAQCGFKRSDQFRSYIESLIETAGYIEDLSPEGEDHPNPEYPWINGAGDIVSPLNHDFTHLDLDFNPKMIKMVQFIEVCFQLAP